MAVSRPGATSAAVTLIDRLGGAVRTVAAAEPPGTTTATPPSGARFAAPSTVVPRPRQASRDGALRTQAAFADDRALTSSALRIDLSATLPACPRPGRDCEPLHIQTHPVTWQAFAVNHTAQRIPGATLIASVYEPFGALLNHLEQRGLVIEPLSAAPALVIAALPYFPSTHLLSLQLHDADGSLLSEHSTWRHQESRIARIAR